MRPLLLTSQQLYYNIYKVVSKVYTKTYFIMIILGIESSCDDTGIALLRAEGKGYPSFEILANELSSQIELHREFGGVVPSLAKREHTRNFVPIFLTALKKAKLLNKSEKNIKLHKDIEKILEREPYLFELFKKEILSLERPAVDAIAVTCGPGLEPALWVGINFARALSVQWDIPLIGTDHMEGHISANLLDKEEIEFPALALTVSGGHTQLVLMPRILEYKLLGETLDDAAGEAFDKVARLLGLPYPGGPEISRIAVEGRKDAFDFPRPLLRQGSGGHSHAQNKYNFSFSGLKTAVLYTVQKMSKKELKEKTPDLASSFQEAVVDTLVTKTIRAAKEYEVKTIMMGGGVAANTALRERLGNAIEKEMSPTKYRVPQINLATDNAAMIAAAGYMHFVRGERSDPKTLAADGNKMIANT